MTIACLYPFSWSLSVIFCIMCEYYNVYIQHAHLLIMNEILEMFTWKTNVLSVFPLFISQFPNFLLYFIFYIWDPCMYITVYIMEACNKDYHYYILLLLTPWHSTLQELFKTLQETSYILLGVQINFSFMIHLMPTWYFESFWTDHPYDNIINIQVHKYLALCLKIS